MSLVRFRNQAFCLKRQNGVLAQSVEHLTFNQVVRGSNPRCLTFMTETCRNTDLCFFIMETRKIYTPVLVHLMTVNQETTSDSGLKV